MILIAGIGNIFMGDDAFGSEVARRLGQHLTLPRARVVDFGIRGLDLAFALMDEYDSTIIVDTTCGGEIPGTIQVIEPDLNELDASRVAIEAHAMDPMRVLALARSMGAQLKNIRIVGCEPESLEPKLGLSSTVAVAVDRAMEVIQSLVSLPSEDTKETGGTL